MLKVKFINNKLNLTKSDQLNLTNEFSKFVGYKLKKKKMREKKRRKQMRYI